MKSSAESTIEDSKTILNEMKKYCQQLYTSQGQTSPDLLSDFLNSGPLRRPDDAYNVPVSVNEIKEEILWNNRFIKIGQESHYGSWIG